MAKAKRVFQVAKQLGVSSKAIVEKCTAEGVPDITNHMSTVKVGLEATICEWFGDVANPTQTAIETADKVDMAKARKGVRRRELAKSTAVVEAEAPDKASQESASKAPPQSADARRGSPSVLERGVLVCAPMPANLALRKHLPWVQSLTSAQGINEDESKGHSRLYTRGPHTTRYQG